MRVLCHTSKVNRADSALSSTSWRTRQLRAGALALSLALAHASAAWAQEAKGTAVAPVGPPVKPALTKTSDPLQNPLLVAADLEYLGAFNMPRAACGWSTAYTYGALTHRYVKEGLRFLSTVHRHSGSLVYEVAFPGLSLTDPPAARLATEWKDIYSDKRWVDNDNGFSKLNSDVMTYGLHWSEERQRLYWNYGHWYNASCPNNPCFGYSTLDDASGQATGVAAIRLRNRTEKFGRGGSLEIPAWFAKRFTAGKTLGVGFGGYFSIVSTGSMGPALCAVDHPDPKTDKHKVEVAQVPLIGYPHANKPPGPPDRAHRNPDYATSYDAWNPIQGIGYWTWSDEIWGGGAWIDLPEKQAVLFFCVLGHGKVWYEKSERHAERGKYWCLAYHPRDLADVAKGKTKEWQIQPAAAWEMKFGDIGPNHERWDGEPSKMVCGATFDARTRRLYILVEGVWRTEVEHHPRVYCWRVK